MFLCVGANSSLSINTEVIIIDPMCVIHNMNKGKPGDPVWPSPEMQKYGGVNGWGDWSPLTGTRGMWAKVLVDILLVSYIISS